MRQADDGVHRRADLVAHVGQETALRLVGGVGLPARGDQLRGAAVHQFLQVMPMLVQFEVDALFFGDVFLHRDIVGDRPVGLVQRRDDGEFDVFAAVLPAVMQLTLPRTALGQRRPHGGEGRRRRLARVQDARILADHFFAAVAGGPREGVVHVLDRCIEAGNHDAFGTLLDGQGKLAQLRLGPARICHVAKNAHEISLAAHVYGSGVDIGEKHRAILAQDRDIHGQLNIAAQLTLEGCHDPR